MPDGVLRAGRYLRDIPRQERIGDKLVRPQVIPAELGSIPIHEADGVGSGLAVGCGENTVVSDVDEGCAGPAQEAVDVGIVRRLDGLLDSAGLDGVGAIGAFSHEGNVQNCVVVVLKGYCPSSCLSPGAADVGVSRDGGEVCVPPIKGVGDVAFRGFGGAVDRLCFNRVRTGGAALHSCSVEKLCSIIKPYPVAHQCRCGSNIGIPGPERPLVVCGHRREVDCAMELCSVYVSPVLIQPAHSVEQIVELLYGLHGG